MNARTGFLIATALSLSLAAAAADAHPKHGRDVVDRSYLYGHVHAPLRSKHMPRWLHHDKRFRHWYRRSAIRHNPYLPWWKVYRVYERQLVLRHYRHHDRWRRHDAFRRHGYAYDDDYYEDYDDDSDERPRRRKRGS